MNDDYTIRHILLMTGLSDRTLRSHIAAGFLQGEKINGQWHFTSEQVKNFLRHPAVRPGIMAKQNAAVYDFLLDGKKTRPRSCMILDLPGHKPTAIIEYFCGSINHGPYADLSFSFDSVDGVPRVILEGPVDTVLALVNGYCEK